MFEGTFIMDRRIPTRPKEVRSIWLLIDGERKKEKKERKKERKKVRKKERKKEGTINSELAVCVNFVASSKFDAVFASSKRFDK